MQSADQQQGENILTKPLRTLKELRNEAKRHSSCLFETVEKAEQNGNQLRSLEALTMQNTHRETAAFGELASTTLGERSVSNHTELKRDEQPISSRTTTSSTRTLHENRWLKKLAEDPPFTLPLSSRATDINNSETSLNNAVLLEEPPSLPKTKKFQMGSLSVSPINKKSVNRSSNGSELSMRSSKKTPNSLFKSSKVKERPKSLSPYSQKKAISSQSCTPLVSPVKGASESCSKELQVCRSKLSRALSERNLEEARFKADISQKLKENETLRNQLEKIKLELKNCNLSLCLFLKLS